MKRLAVFLLATLTLSCLCAAPKAPKWLVLDKITYQHGVNAAAFDGIDQLLLTKLVQAKKYKCLDRDAYDTAAREEGFGGKAELIPAGYSMRGEIVQLQPSGKSRSVGNTTMTEYVATVSIRANDLRTQQPYEAETLRVTACCQTPKDMLVFAVKRMALAILMRDYPMYVMDEDDGELTLSYGADFLTVGEQYEVRRCKAIVDDDTGETVNKEKTVGVCEVSDVGKNTSTARLVSGKAKVKDVLRFHDKADPFEVTPPAAEGVAAQASGNASLVPRTVRRIAVAPFISKSSDFSVWGLKIASRTWMDDVKSHLDIALTQCGSFKVLDRTFGPEIDRELDRIVKDPNASPNDICRLSKKLATDYLVVAEVTFSNVASPGTDFATGLPIKPPSALFAEVRFRCVMAPTTQIAWADIVRLDAALFGGTAEQFSSASAQYAAQSIVQRLQYKLDPAGFAETQKAAAAAAAAAPATTAPASAPAASQGVQLGF